MKKTLLSSFYINLIQDINILRPLIYLMHDDFGIKSKIIVSNGFIIKNENNEYWLNEIKRIAEECNSEIIIQYYIYQIWALANEYDKGFLVSASESSIKGHLPSHHLFKILPKNITSVCIQHGYECPGFLMNRNHQKAHGSSVDFNADVIAGWIPAKYQLNLRQFQNARYYCIGSPLHIKNTSKRRLNVEDQRVRINNKECGIICENLHSARHDDVKGESFLEQFYALASMLDKEGEKVGLRPHPAGQYTIKNQIDLPKNVFIDNRPSYRIDWRKYKYGISAPSSILIDLVSESVPCMVWQDKRKTIDIDQYKFLTVANNEVDMFQFTQNPNLEFVKKNMNGSIKYLIENRASTHKKYIEFFQNIIGAPTSALTSREIIDDKDICQKSKYRKCRNILIIAPGRNLPSANICLKIPLEQDPANNIYLLEESDIRESESGDIADDFKKLVSRKSIDVVLMCRCFGENAEKIVAKSRQMQIPTIYFLDDDLVVPCKIALSPKKFRMHSSPERTKSIGNLMNNVDYVYASTAKLKERLESYNINNKIVNTKINCSPAHSVDITKQKSNSLIKKIGYMGFGHGADFEIVGSALRSLMKKYEFIRLELIGSIEIPELLQDMESRIKSYPPIFDYKEFLKFLELLEWDIGICPLATTDFNECKSINKWIEYASCGIPTIATGGSIYDICVSGMCGILCENTHESWYSAMESVLFDSNLSSLIRFNAHTKAWREYSPMRHAEEINSIIDQCKR